MNEVILLTGGNLGDRLTTLTAARTQITLRVGRITKASSIYETAAWGNPDQPPFLNQVLVAETTLSPQEVLEQILSIEIELGRKRIEKWGPRAIDIDILFYDSAVVETNNLRIPHPEIPNRRFVLAPLAEVVPGLIHPVLGMNVSELLARTPDTLEVRRLA